ncbi:hypothetical protein CSW57_22945 [Williamsia muralis]|uniref:DUF2631 domain-containing protein n=1 Tax=Williamsia marianensis TaxID=85044 RepID=A0A2G3PG19_WILMA|nr:hypothetical protein CSW57_22945 [Williamsia marianensis]PZU02056.1 MAG: DUF2631 domain-containing protein [Gordonia sp. (in: high G+C Gram-positive bacteria)]
MLTRKNRRSQPSGVAVASTEVEYKREPADAPSARFGWHGEGLKTFKIAGWVSIVALLVMMIGNHEGHVEDLFLLGFALLLAFILIRGEILSRRKWAIKK